VGEIKNVYEVSWVGEIKNVYEVLAGKPEAKGSLGTLKVNQSRYKPGVTQRVPRI